MVRSAPGKYYRKRLFLLEVTRIFPDDDTARAWIESVRWPDVPVCSHGGSHRVTHPVKHKTMTHRCKDYRKWFSACTGTQMQSSKLDLQVWVLAFYLLNTGFKGQVSMKLHRDLGVTQKAAWHLAHRIRKSWNENEGNMFSGLIEADETYIGVKERDTGWVAAQGISQTDASFLQGFVRGHAAPGATLYTDEATAYRGMPEYDHEAVNGPVGEYAREMVHTNGMVDKRLNYRDLIADHDLPSGGASV